MLFHVSEDGSVNPCNAQEGNCPIMFNGEATKHFKTEAEVEEYLSTTYGSFKTMNKKVIIAVDMDNTVVDFNDGLRRYMARRKGLSYEEALKRYPDPTNYNYAKGDTPWFKDTSEFLEYFKEAEKDGLYSDLKYRNGAIKVLKNLLKDERVEVKIVTARSEKYNDQTMESLGSEGFQDLSISNVVNKEDYEAHIFIDDKDDFAEKIRSGEYLTSDKIVKEVIIPYQHYNSHLNPSKTWDDIKNELDKTIDRIYKRLS